MTQYAIVRFLDDRKVSWSDFAADYLKYAKIRMRPKTVKCLIEPTIKLFSAFIGAISLQEITPAMIANWAAQMGGASNSVSVRLNTIRFILNHAVKMKQLSENPARGVPRPAIMFTGRCLTDEEIQILMPHLPSIVQDISWFMLYTGLRPGEALGLEWSEITEKDGQYELSIPAHKSKSKRARNVLL
jgi:integrase